MIDSWPLRGAAVRVKSLQRMDRRFEAIDRRFDAIDLRFVGIDRRLEGIDGRIEGLDTRVSRQFTWLVGLHVTTLAAVVAPSSRADDVRCQQPRSADRFDPYAWPHTGVSRSPSAATSLMADEPAHAAACVALPFAGGQGFRPCRPRTMSRGLQTFGAGTTGAKE